jgi:hypothetical protein
MEMEHISISPMEVHWRFLEKLIALQKKDIPTSVDQFVGDLVSAICKLYAKDFSKWSEERHANGFYNDEEMLLIKQNLKLLSEQKKSLLDIFKKGDL